MKTLYLDHNIKIPYEDIMYFEHHHHYLESFNRVTILYTTTTKYILGYKIKDLYSILNSDIFMIPHQSYIVNMNYIKIFTQNHLVLDNNTRIPISTKRSSQLRKQFLLHIKRDLNN